MNILIVNDDGIRAPGIIKLAECAKWFGHITVVAPMHQCSGMSQKMTIFDSMECREIDDFPIPDTNAWAVDGTPVDCVKVGIEFLMSERPDFVLSGINFGYNTAYDIAYSGTLGAAFESVMLGIPAAAFSSGSDAEFGDVDMYLKGILGDYLESGIKDGLVYNVNFPGVAADGIKGIMRNTQIGRSSLYEENYCMSTDEKGRMFVTPHGVCRKPEETAPGTDSYAVMHGFISDGYVRCCVL